MSGDANHTDAHALEMPHASLRDYAIGFVLSVILTAIPFWLVMAQPLAAGPTVAMIRVLIRRYGRTARRAWRPRAAKR